MKAFVLFLFVIFVPAKEYVVLDIRENKMNYIILLRDVNSEDLYCIESVQPDTIPEREIKIKVGDTIAAKLSRIKKTKFKVSQDIPFFDDLTVYDDSLKVDKDHYCRELRGLYIMDR